MSHCSWLMFLVLAADDPTKAAVRPQGPAPIIQVVTFKEGKLEWKVTEVEYRTEKRVRDVAGPDGKVKKEEFTVTVPVFVPKVMQVEAAKCKISRVDGKPVKGEDLPKLLGKPTAVLMPFDDKPIDKFYLEYLKEDALVVVGPPREG